MADKLTIRRESENAGGLVANRRLYETRDGRVVEEGDPDAHRLIAGAGQVIPAKTAARLGLKEGAGLPEKTRATGEVVSTAPAEPQGKPVAGRAVSEAQGAEPDAEAPKRPRSVLSTESIGKRSA